MAILFACGFEAGSNAFYDAAGFYSSNISSTHRHRTTDGLKGGNYSQYLNAGIGMMWNSPVWSTTCRRLHFWAWYDDTSDLQLRVRRLGSAQVMLVIRATGYIELWRGSWSSLLATSATPITPWVPNVSAAWVCIDLVAANAGGSFEVFVNGVSMVSYAGDTQELADADWDQFSMTWGYYYFDDIIVTDAATPRLAEWYGVAQVPSADAPGCMLTPRVGVDNYAMVDAIPAVTTDWNEAAALLDEDIYVTANPANVPSNVLAVVAWAWSARDGAITQIRLGMDIGAGTVNSAYTVLPASPATQATWYIRETNPAGAAWSAADLNALQLHAQFN